MNAYRCSLDRDFLCISSVPGWVGICAARINCLPCTRLMQFAGDQECHLLRMPLTTAIVFIPAALSFRQTSPERPDTAHIVYYTSQQRSRLLGQTFCPVSRPPSRRISRRPKKKWLSRRKNCG